MKNEQLVIIGNGEFAEIAFEYFTHDSPYEVAGFAVDRAFVGNGKLYELPVIGIDELQERFPPAAFKIFVAVTFTQLNRLRTRLLQKARALGYTPATYISSKAFVWHNAIIGENCFIFENNVIQHHAAIDDNVVLWSGNHVGHRARIRANTFVSSHVVVSGYCDVGESCFLGVNSTLGDRVKVGNDCVIGAGAVILKNTENDRIYRGNPAVAAGGSSRRLFGAEGGE